MNLRIGPRGSFVVPSTLLTGLVSYWALGEASGTRSDAVGSNHLSDGNTVGSAAGINGQGADFVAANNEYLEKAAPVPPVLNADYTISAWFQNSDNVGYQMIVTKGIDMEIRRNPGTYNILFISGTLTGAVPYTPGAWNSVICWRSGTGIYMSVNGADPITGVNSSGVDAGSALRIGARTDGYYWNGQIDEVAIWSRVLTPAERTDLYNAGAGKFYPTF